jgi:hypothetical protein
VLFGAFRAPASLVHALRCALTHDCSSDGAEAACATEEQPRMSTRAESLRSPRLAPAERALRRFEQWNLRVGHENAGFLSAASGFLPSVPPLTRLDARFAAWDELAAELPSLHRELELRRRVEQLPLLDASQLAPRELLRASALLAIVAHAYWYVDTRPPARLPDALHVPWAQVRARLGQRQAVLSYVDLIVYNWRLRSSARIEPLTVDNLDLLLPAIGNEEERVFYLTQLEILARARSVVQLVATAQSAAIQDDAETLERCLAKLGTLLADCTRALAQIDPRSHAHSHVDPVRWAKTVAPFAVPMRRGDLGPSGTSSPLFSTLDVFFGRTQYRSQLGREIERLRLIYPPAWRGFLRALAEAPVRELAMRSGSPALRDAWNHALDRYAGDAGFLGRHRVKVYGYLEIAFKVGRSLTIGGFGGPFADRTWNEVDSALASARAERPQRESSRDGGPAPRAESPVAAGSVHPVRALDWSAIAQHNTAEHGYWLVVDGRVHDVSRFLQRHPGGQHVLRAYAGLDASAGFARAHAGQPRVTQLLDRLRIGKVRPLELAPRIASAYQGFVQALQLVVEMQNAYAIDRTFALDGGGTSIASDSHARTEPRPRYEILRGIQRHERFLCEYVAVIEAQALPQLWAAADGMQPHEQGKGSLRKPLAPLDRNAHENHALAIRTYDAFDQGPSGALDELVRRLEARDAALLDELKTTLTRAVRAFECHDARSHERTATRAYGSWLRCVAALRRYHRQTPAHECELVGGEHAHAHLHG